MAIVFVIIGIAAVAIGVRGQASAAGQLLASEFTGPNSYIEWLAAILILGAIGIWKPARPAANAMIGLVILAMFLRKGQGFFSQINSALTSATATPRPAAAGSTAAGSAAPAGSQSPPAPGQPQSIGDWLRQFEDGLGIGPDTAIGKGILNAVPSVPEFNLAALNSGDAFPLTGAA